MNGSAESSMDGRMPPPRTSGTGERLRTYLLGVGIGVVVLGMFWMMKWRAQQAQGGGPGSGTPSGPASPVRNGVPRGR